MKRKLLLVGLTAALSATALAALCACGEKDLTAPEGVTYDGTVFSWNPVEGAEKYSVSVNNTTEMSVAGTAYTMENKNANNEKDVSPITISIRAVGGEGYKDSPAVTYTFNPLAGVGEVTVDDEGNLSWETVSGATGYAIRVDGTTTEQVSTTFDSLTEGTHKVSVKATATSTSPTTLFYSPWSKEKSLTICGNVDKDSITYDSTNAVLKWKGVKNAQKYHLQIAGAGINVNEEVTTTSYQFNADNGNFDVTIRPIGNHSTSFDAKADTDKTFVYLDTATGLKVVDGILIWDEVAGADGYQVKVNNVIRPEKLTEERFDGKFAANTPIKVQVLPVSNDTAYFTNWSDVLEFRILPAPVLQWSGRPQDGGAINNCLWDEVQNTAGYDVLITNPDGSEASRTVTQPTFEADFRDVGEYTIKVKANADTSNSTVCDSAYSEPIKVIRLAAPKFVAQNSIDSDPDNGQGGFTVTYQAVAGAKGYRITKDGTEIATTDKTQYKATNIVGVSDINEHTYGYAIQSIGGNNMVTVGNTKTVILDSLTANNLTFDITVLGVPQQVTMDGFNIKYAEIGNAKGYTIDVGGESYVSGNLSYGLSFLDAGSYIVSVNARGNGERIISSNYSSPVYVNRLAAPTNIRIGTEESADGTLEFEKVTNATSYTAMFGDDVAQIPVTELGNIRDRIKIEGTVVRMVAIANCYDKVKTDTYYMTSPISQSVEFVKLATPTFGARPYSNSEFRWEFPVYSDYPNVQFKVYNQQNIMSAIQFNGNAMKTDTLEAGEYAFKVKAIGNGTKYINSDVSEVRKIHKLTTPTVEIEGGNYIWYGVANAASYEVTIDNTLKTVEALSVGEKHTFTPTFDKIGTYQVRVKAIGDDGVSSIDSNPLTFTQTTKQLTTPEFSFRYVNANGELQTTYDPTAQIEVNITTESKWALGYYYSVGGVQPREYYDTTYKSNPNGTGRFEIKVVAAGGGFDGTKVGESNYYVDSQVAGGSGDVIYLLAAPNKDSIDFDGAGRLTWGDSKNAETYELEITLTVKTEDGGTETVTKKVEAKTAAYNVCEGLHVAYKNVKTISVVIRAKGGQNHITSQDETYSNNNVS